MSEFQYPAMTRVSIKNMPDNYPQPKCDPKKVITLPPAAQKFTAELPASIIFRHHDKHRNPPNRMEPQTGSNDGESGKPTSQQNDREDTSPRKRSIPYARTVGAGQSPSVTNGARYPSGKATQPVTSNMPRPQSTDEGATSVQERYGAKASVPKKMSVEGGVPSAQRKYGAPQTVRGSTIPRQPQMNGICSPAVRSGRGKAHGMGNPFQLPTKH